VENNRVLVIDDDGSIKKVCSLYLLSLIHISEPTRPY